MPPTPTRRSQRLSFARQFGLPALACLAAAVVPNRLIHVLAFFSPSYFPAHTEMRILCAYLARSWAFFLWIVASIILGTGLHELRRIRQQHRTF